MTHDLNGKEVLLTSREAAEYLGIALGTLQAWRTTGRVKIPFVRMGGKNCRYFLRDLKEFMELRRTTDVSVYRYR